ncbi:MAG: transglycosylase SLT domain-containing protein [Legionellaceae bacterium]|nr:transglycosylase SLT domain-containing protein [Legionellaceae bacterium]
MSIKKARVLCLGLILVVLTSCMTPTPPNKVDNICSVFKQYPSWRSDALATERHWQVPVAVQMAIIHQESKFNPTAKPKRTKLLWVIPWTRPSTAYGYSQVLDSTWKIYKKKRGWIFSSRDSFGDATDFIGWYAHQAYIREGISRSDSYSLYLAYHEGITGFKRRTYLKKPWLMAVARKVERRTKIYQSQLAHCR